MGVPGGQIGALCICRGEWRSYREWIGNKGREVRAQSVGGGGIWTSQGGKWGTNSMGGADGSLQGLGGKLGFGGGKGEPWVFEGGEWESLDWGGGGAVWGEAEREG